MFLYTSFEILLYVVSIFNTSANVKSFFDFHPNSELSDLSLPFCLFPDYQSYLQQRSLSSQELTFAVPLTY